MISGTVTFFVTGTQVEQRYLRFGCQSRTVKRKWFSAFCLTSLDYRSGLTYTIIPQSPKCQNLSGFFAPVTCPLPLT